MGRGLAIVGVIGFAATGCLWEKRLDDRPARLQLGVNSRRIVVAAPVVPVGGYLARTTTDPPASEAGTSSAVTGSAQFTMAYRYHTYLGAEVEAGRTARSGSNIGGAYAVVGAETASTFGSLSVELTAGRRWLRYELGSEDVPTTALEPRVRGQLWLSPQVTLGGVIGANAMPGEGGWMAGLYLGVYSSLFNTWK